MKIFGLTIVKASRLKKKLDLKPRNEREKAWYFYIKGLYDSRFCGIVAYRELKFGDFDLLFMHIVIDTVCEHHCQTEKKITARICDDCGAVVQY